MPPPDDAAAVLRLALPGPDLDLAVDPDSVLLTPHAVQRYRERIEGVPARLAVRGLRRLISTAHWQSRPTYGPPVVLRPDVIYGFSETCPDACLLLRDKVLVTVLVRDRRTRPTRSPTHARGTACRGVGHGDRARRTDRVGSSPDSVEDRRQ